MLSFLLYSIFSSELICWNKSILFFLITLLSSPEIISILTSSVQKIEIEQQLDKARITELETKVSEQQSIINNIIERLNNIGA